MSTIIQPKGKVYLYQKQFDKLVKEERLVAGIEYCIIDDKTSLTEYIESSSWTDVNSGGDYSYQATSEKVYSEYSSVDLKATFDVGNYGIAMYELNEEGKIIFYAINKPDKDIILNLEASK